MKTSEEYRDFSTRQKAEDLIASLNFRCMVRLLALHKSKKISTSEWEGFKSLVANPDVDEESACWIEDMSRSLLKYTATKLGVGEIKQLMHAVC
jgi:hypothetical protein